MILERQSLIWRWYTVGLLWTAGICAAMQFSKMSIGLKALEDALGTDATSVSALMAATGLFGLLFGVGGASISDALGLRRVLLYSIFAAAIFSFAESFIPQFIPFYGLRLLEGVTNLFIVVAAPTLIALYAPSRHVAIAMGLWGSFYGVAFALSGLSGPTLISNFGARGLLAAHGFVALAIALLLAIHRLPGVEKMRDTDSAKNVRAVFANQVDTIIRAYKNARTALPGLIFLFHSSLYLGFLIFVPLSAQDVTGRDILLVSMPLVSIAATLLAGPISQVLPIPAVLTTGFLLEMGIAGLLIPATGVDVGTLTYNLLANGLMLISGVLQGSIFILVPKLAANSRDETLAFGVIAQLGSLGSIVGPMAFAASIAKGGIVGFATLVAIGAVAGASFSFIGLRQRDPRLGSSRKSDSNSKEEASHEC
ncbi:MFS transporter [Rhizobium rhizogenes]|uniref:MFS transporter n=1 Tax=Rhizobium rhizogenes TaxID=359 RepID=UPI001572199C|nr:MFS transporter [Rhizobium rhizogenes]NTF85389.1 MFS transporter [Rhizobium rhizogenes]NTI31334.1 MFS transporter [Rhizobium rhizogenes]